MKKATLLVVIVCMLVGVATAAAGTSKYRGPIDPAGRLSFELQKKQGKQRVIALRWTALPVDCAGTPHTTSGVITYKVPVKQGSFHAKGVLGRTKDPDASAEIRGTLAGKSASGTIKLLGKKLPLDPKGTDNCKSGTLNWSASR